MVGKLRAAALLLLGLAAASPRCGALDDTPATAARRAEMVRFQIRARGVRDPAVLAAMGSVPRHLFVPPGLRSQAYHDNPLPIGEGQTISQPYIVALMSELLRPAPGQRVLEVGTGSGYQAAVLAAIGAEVYTIEIKERLFREGAARLRELGCEKVHARHGDGYYGWEEQGPFDGILITAAVDHVPPPLLLQLVEGGRMVLPLGHPFGYQNLVVVTRRGEDYTVEQITGVLFVPMTGKALEERR